MKKKILIVDDEQDYGEMVKINLEMAGDYEVCVQPEAKDALETVKKFHPSLILLDVIMRNISGHEVAKQLQKDAEVKDIPVIFMTATPGAYDIPANMAYIQKPVSTQDLIKLIEKRLKECS